MARLLAQVSPQWTAEQDATAVVRSLKTERMKQNLGPRDLLTGNQLMTYDYDKINYIQQHRWMPSATPDLRGTMR